ncbi:MAG: hypothetical protein KAR47_11995 [Planctomycetes bacterium]|nr:hypothetical protein [Planctomycetota bacterium]
MHKKDDNHSKDLSGQQQKLFMLAFVLTLLLIIGLRIFKADHTGLYFDEARTYRSYTTSIHKALTGYRTSNNHVLNSIFIYYSHKLFGSYEHYIRIPSMLAGTMFSLSLAYIICKTIRSRILRIGTLAMSSLVPFVFMFSFLARGYAYILAVVFTQIAFVLLLYEHKIRYRYWPVVAVVISMLNFIAAGTMITSVLILAAFNLVFVLAYSYRIFKDPPGKLKTIFVTGTSILLTSAVSILWLYRHLYARILEFTGEQNLSDGVSGWDGWSSLLIFFRQLLIDKVFKEGDREGAIFLYALLSLLGIALAFGIYRFSREFKAGRWRMYFADRGGQNLVFAVTLLTFLFLFVQGVIFNKTVGWLRNHVWMIPLVLLSGMLIMDRFIGSIRKKIPRLIVHVVTAVIVISITLNNLPSARFSGRDSMSGPLLRELKKLDPDKIWNIAFSKKMGNLSMCTTYYRQFGYKFNWTKMADCNVYVCHITERPDQAVCLNWNYLRRFGGVAVLNYQLPSDKVVLSAEVMGR